jgi:diguanylate cyclase (GGDEF)-like protein
MPTDRVNRPAERVPCKHGLERTPSRTYTRPRYGMAASDKIPQSHPAPAGAKCLPAAALRERLDEEISRGERYGTELSCLLVLVENLDELVREHGSDLREQTLEYIAAALPRELRRFDRIGRPSERELLIVLPGADGPRGEVVARRVLDRVRTIKIEVAGSRRPLRVAVGLTAWREEDDSERLLARARAAAARSGAGADDVPSAAGEREPTREPHDFSLSNPAHGTPPASGPRAAS